MAASISYREVQADLARWIRFHRSECIPSETARQLLSYDRPDHTHLVGIDYEAEKAVFYHCEDRYSIAVRFADSRLADGGPKLATFRDGPGIETWVRRLSYFWGWIHPRYR